MDRVASSHRVARRFVAEILTKSWLLGIRRGWLSLMGAKPKGWAQIHKATANLIGFLDNLEDEVMWTRRAPYSSREGDDQVKLKALFKKARDAVKEHQSRIETWEGVQTGVDLRAVENYGQAAGEKMLALYESDFGGLMTLTVRSKVNPKKNQWNSHREASITEVVDDILEILRKEAADLQKSVEVSPEDTERWHGSVFREYNLHGMKVVIEDSTMAAGVAERYLKFFEKAYALLRSKGLAKVWAGTTLVQCNGCGGVNRNTGGGVGGNYTVATDTVRVFHRPAEFIVELMVHELGHRHWYKGMTQAQREKFRALIHTYEQGPATTTVLPEYVDRAEATFEKDWVQPLLDQVNRIERFSDRPGDLITLTRAMAVDAPKLVAHVKKIWVSWDTLPKDIQRERERAITATERVAEFMLDAAGILAEPLATSNQGRDLIEIMDGAVDKFLRRAKTDWDAARESDYLKDQRPVLPVSDYGKSNPSEAFAEAFAYYVTEQEMTRDQIDSFKAVIKTGSVDPAE